MPAATLSLAPFELPPYGGLPNPNPGPPACAEHHLAESMSVNRDMRSKMCAFSLIV